jgi:hypothetical protein
MHDVVRGGMLLLAGWRAERRAPMETIIGMEVAALVAALVWMAALYLRH